MINYFKREETILKKRKIHTMYIRFFLNKKQSLGLYRGDLGIKIHKTFNKNQPLFRTSDEIKFVSFEDFYQEILKSLAGIFGVNRFL